jgi:hypothetical protein
LQGPQGDIGSQGPQGSSFVFEGYWNNSTAYDVGDVVTWDNSGSDPLNTYIAINANTASDPITVTADWDLFIPAGSSCIYIGYYSASTTYDKNDVVTWDNSGTGIMNAYVSLIDSNISYDPVTSATEWALFVPGGAAGAQGATGPQGAQGPQGFQGPQGASAGTHASSHIRGGADIVDGDRIQVDYSPTAYTRNSGASGAGATTDLTAHLDGINSALALTQNQQTGTTYTLVLSDRNKLVELNNASAITLTVPINSSVAYPVGSQITLLQTGTGQVTISSSATINATPGLKLRTQWSSCTLIKRATDTWVAIGDLVA